MLQPASDRRWLAVMAAITAVETCWWTLCWNAGLAPPPFILLYLAVAVAALGAAWVLRLVIAPGRPRPRWWSVAFGTVLVGGGASLFLPLKYAIPGEVGFWLDGPLAAFERNLFGTDPWHQLDRLLGWAVVPLDRIYGLWLPAQLLVLFLVILEPPSSAKSRALIAHSLAWLALGVVAATLLSSVGPIFYDRLLGGHRFAPLAAMLHGSGAWMAVTESDAMWASFASAHPGTVAGISAMPSMHVAMSFWMVLAARALAPRAAPYALGYTLLIWIGSVQLGWHYVVDGLAGIAGMAAIWAIAGLIGRRAGADPTAG